ncbi:histidine phosphatase family protein [Pseudomonas sp. SWRI107]|uniref:histidine phosphatase family protein n=1 Tax=Pseudomonas TaxID=286 RepID=UPI001647DDA4|nr:MULTISPECIES: histidine phosphatase family protein [Pseudomonas]MBC3413513.1 histidine phosphatase family protein [Pseudomonas sp. SWRI51]MBV4530717.1 histidine phosphatase family protein [Pseudomonas farsensis]
MKLPTFLRRRHLLLGLALACAAIPPALVVVESRAQPVDGTQTLVFLRHAEKPGEGLGQLNCQGLNRALDLATVLPERFGDADYVFAANPSRHVEEGSQDLRYSYIRPLMTITPSAIRLGLPVNIDYSANDTDALADELLSNKYRNATVYTAWSHGYLPELINTVAGKALGEERVITEDWSGDDFDTLYVLTLTWHDGKATLLSRNVRQQLDGGSKACPT